MKLCRLHDDALRAALTERGLGALIVEDRDLAEAHLADAIEFGPTIDNFEPRAAAYNAIVNNTLCVVPPTLISSLLIPPPGRGEVCPLCFLLEHSGRRYDHWIAAAADEVVELWRALGTGATT